MNQYLKEAIESIKKLEEAQVPVGTGSQLYYAIDMVKQLDHDIEKYGLDSALNYLSISLNSIIKVYGDIQKANTIQEVQDSKDS